jgi:hypothetical protein
MDNAKPVSGGPYDGLERHLVGEGLAPEDLVGMLELTAVAIEQWDRLTIATRGTIRQCAPKFAAAMDALSTENRAD